MEKPFIRFELAVKPVGIAVLAVIAGLVSPDLCGQAAPSGGTIENLKMLSIDELMDLEVTSVSRRPERLSETASAIQVITGDDIRLYGAENLPESLRLATNLQVARKGAHAWGISARGFNTELANKLLVLVDGRTVYTPLYSGVFWDRQDYLMADIDRIEVISGPGGTVWGTNAVNGVINVTSKSAKDTQGLYIEGGAGSSIDSLVAMRYGGSLAPNVSYRVYGKYFERDSEFLPNGNEAGDGWNSRQGGFRVDATPSPQDTWTLQGDLYRANESVTTGGVGVSAGGNVLGRWSRSLANDSNFKVQVYFDHTHLVSPTPGLVLGKTTFAPAGTLRDDLDTYDIDLQHDLNFGGAQQVVWGAGYRYTRDRVGNAPAVAFLPPKLNQGLFSVFVQDKIAIGSSLSLTLGSKLERTDYTGWEVEPGARLQLDAGQAGMFWGAVSRAVRAPSRIDRDLSQAPPPSLVLLKGSPNFDSETVVAYEAGWRGQISAKTSLAVSTYYNVYDNLRSTSTTPVTVLPFFFANNLEGNTYGLEFSGTYRPSDIWELTAGYNLLREHLRVKPGRADLNAARNETSDPEQQFSIRSSLRLSTRWEFSTAFRWVDTLQTHNGTAPATTPGYSALDLRVGWRATDHLELSVVAQDLLDDTHPEFGFASPSREEIGRSVFGKAVIRY